jgi:integrase
MAATTGMRRGEILGLRWQDIDLETARVAVRQTLISVDYRIEISTPKTASGRRSIAIDPTTVAALRRHRVLQLEEKLALGDAYDDLDLVFAGPTGGFVHPDGFGKAFQRLQSGADLPRIRFHDLRHTHATLALEGGIQSRVVSERLGHSTVAMTLDTYSHVLPGLQEAAAERFAKLLFDQP